MPKQSSTPYHWLKPGYFEDKQKTSAAHHIPFAATYVTFPSTPEIDISTPWGC